MSDINFTFGIITDASQASVEDYLPKVIKSIKNLNIPKYEILIIGDTNKINDVSNLDTKLSLIHFDESRVKNWITKKKNIITENAKFDNIVLQHDYIVYDSNWYNGWLKYGDNFKICMNKIINYNGERFRDWVLFPQSPLFEQMRKECNIGENLKRSLLIPYNETGFSLLQYFSGAYWVAKKKVMEEFPLNESLVWERGEDVEWSFRIRKKYNFSINPNSTVYFLKHKNPVFTEMPRFMYTSIKNFLKKRKKYRM